MDKIRLIRCIPSSVYHDIKQDAFNGDTVGVYYGFDSYNASVARINELTKVIKQENPGIREDDMDIVFITRGMSNRHAHLTMINIRQPVAVVKAALDNYITL